MTSVKISWEKEKVVNIYNDNNEWAIIILDTNIMIRYTTSEDTLQVKSKDLYYKYIVCTNNK